MKKESQISIPKQEWKFFLDQLRKWYHPEKRKLPWKDIDDAYLVWVSEVFLQQTQADRVVEFFLRFTAKFPTVEHLAKASFEEALPYFKGLGFYGRLRRMLETARGIVASSKLQDPSGKAQFPKEISELEKLPGIGPYTARAVASFAYKQKVLAPDTNVARILMRFFGNSGDSADRGNSGKWVMKNLEWFDQNYPKDFNLNQVLMDFGSLCSAAAPKCQQCPLLKKCSFGNSPERFLQQVRKPKVSIPRHYKKVVVGILIQGKKVLVSKRRRDQTYSGLFEFPGGKVEVGEDERRALQREFLEEVGVEISVRPPFEKIVQHEKKQVLYFHRCRILTGKPQSMEGQDVLWMDQDQLDPKIFLPSNKTIIDQLKKSRL
jgi:A/G-specific adenine glycosylase